MLTDIREQIAKPTAEQIQIVFNWLMYDETDDPKKGGWWGTSDQVEDVKTLIQQLLASFLALPIRTVTETCQNCNGTGRKANLLTVLDCPHCHGSRTVTRTVTLGEALETLEKIVRLVHSYSIED